MARYLSDEWLDRLAGLIASPPAPPEGWSRTVRDVAVDATNGGVPGGAVVVEMVVTGCPVDIAGPDGVRTFHLVVEGVGARLGRGRAPTPDVRLTLDHATASAVARGALNVQQAIAAGRCRVGGHPDRLTAAAPVLDRLARAVAVLRTETEVPA